MPGPGFGGRRAAARVPRGPALPALLTRSANPSAYYLAATVPAGAVLEKLRSDFIEFAVYQPITADGIEWARWLYSTRLAAGSTGLVEIAATRARLYASTAVVRPAANAVAGTMSGTPSATLGVADATSRTGSWTAAATVLGTANTRYSTTAGDTVRYTITVPAGGTIYLVHPATTNGGVGTYTVTRGGVEIGQSEYRGIPNGGGTWKVDTRDEQLSPGTTYSALATVASAGSHVVTFTVSSEVAGGRLYDAGLRAYPPIPVDSAGIHGSAIAVTTSGWATLRSFKPGVTYVLSYPACTRVDVNYLRLTTGGQALISLYNAAGVLVASETVDSYFTTTAWGTWSRGGLPKGVYHAHVRVLSTRNAAVSTGNVYRWYQADGVAYDESVAGTPGVDAFDIGDIPANVSSALNVGTSVLLGPGNLAHASRWSASSGGAAEFVSGVHGLESALTYGAMAFKVDGVAVDMAAAAVGARFIGQSATLDFATTLSLPVANTPFATLARAWTWDRAGWRCATTRTTTAPAYRTIEYDLMLQAPNGGDARSSAVGALNRVWSEVAADNILAATSADITTTLAGPRTGFALIGSGYAALAWIESGPAQSSGLVRDLSAKQVKGYTLGAVSDPVNGELVPAGDVRTVVKRYRIVKAAFA